MTKLKRPLAEAEAIAARLVEDLQPHCERLAIAGSVRRRTPEVGDLEIVCIPRMEMIGLFGDRPQSALYAYLQRTEAVFLKGNNPTGRYHQLLLANGMQLDLFTAAAGNWGLILMIRTGSALFSQSMLARWKACQRLGKDQRGSVDGHLVTGAGHIVPTPTEEEVFRLCRVPFIPPEERGEALR